MRKQAVAVLPGILSGPYTTHQLRKLLVAAGYEIANDPSEADIILAHSAGPLWLPNVSKRQTTILIDPPYWPGRTIRERVRDRVRSNFQFHRRGIPTRRWLARQLWGAYYALRNPLRTRYVLRNMAAYDLLKTLGNCSGVVLVRNELDDWLTPDLTALEQAYPKLKIIELPGDHDDFNYNPARYVNLLQSLAGKTAV